MVRFTFLQTVLLCFVLFGLQLVIASIAFGEVFLGFEMTLWSHQVATALIVLSTIFAGVLLIGLSKLRARDQLHEDALHAVGKLSIRKMDDFKRGGMSINEYAQECTKIVADALNVDRVGIWLFSDNDQALVATDIYLRSDGKHETGAQLNRSDYPLYFDAVGSSWAIDASDAENDPRTSEFKDGYLRPLGIRSMLDSMLYSGERLVGVVCHEQKGKIRKWSAAEIRFGGSIARLISLALEIEARRVAESKVRAALVAAESANQAKTTFLVNLSHEVRTPLNAIIGFAQIGALRAAEQGGSVTSEFHSLFEQSQWSGEHLLRMFEDLINISQIELGVLNVKIETLSVSDLLSELKSIVQDVAQKKHITLHTDCSTVSMVEADRKLLLQVLINLTVNSIKYSADGTAINVQVKPGVDGQNCTIAIADQGAGMSPAEIQVALRRFERLDNKETTAEGGLGIGLPLAKHMVEAQGGVFEISSQKNQGTVISIQLPISQIEQSVSAA